MENAISWAIIGVFTLFLALGFLIGVVRGLKRSAIHIAFVFISVILALLLTKVVTSLVIGIKLPIGGNTQTISDYILSIIQKSFNITDFQTATDFVTSLPLAVASPFVFFALQIVISGLFEIVYAIVVRVSFGKKKEDFKNHKPRRAYGGVIGLVEGLFVLVLMFAPITALAKTASSVLNESTAATTTAEVVGESNKMQTSTELANKMLPKEVKQYVNLYSNSVIGKVSGAVGVDTLMFDYLTSISLNGEKINLRKDSLDAVEAYDNFVVVYNEVSTQNYEVSVKKLVESVKKLTKSPIFKTVVCDTARDVVVNYERVKTDLHLNLPEILDGFIQNLKAEFEASSFNAYDYMSHEANIFLDVLQNSFEEGLVKDFATMENTQLTTILDVIDDNWTEVKNEAKNLLKLNVVETNFEYIVDKASTKLKEVVDASDEVVVALNGKISNKEAAANKIFDIAKDLKGINDDLISNGITISELVDGDTFTKLADIEDVAPIMTKIGNILDTARNFELLVLPETSTDPKIYVMDNILKCYNMELLGDYDTYTEVFETLTAPIQNAKELGLVDVIKGEELNIISVLDKVKANPNILKTTIVPFYTFKHTKIGEQTLKEMVFDKAITTLSDDIGILDFSQYQLAANDTKENWEMAFEGLGTTLKQLHSINVGTTGKTFAKYLIDGGDIKDLQMSDIGKVLDIIKLNAYNNGNTLKGVLNDKFAEAIYVMTGDMIISGKDYSGLTAIDNYEDIKAYIGADTAGYYQVSFEQKLAQVDKAIELCDKMKDNTEGLDVKTQTQAVVDGLKDATDAMGMTDEELVETLENLEDLVESSPGRKIFETDSLTAEEKEEARDKITEKYAGHTAVANALISLFGL